MGDFIDDLLKALKDKKVRERIQEIVFEEEKKKSIFSKETDSKWKEKVNSLNDSLIREKNKNEQVENELLRLQKQLKEREEQLWKMQTENQKLRKTAEEAEKKIQYAEQVKVLMVQENEKEQDEARKRLSEAEKVSAYYQNGFRRLDTYYRLYQQLGEELHQDLNRVLRADSPENFIFCGSQWGNIEALWEFMDIHLGQDKYTAETIGELEKIFSYFFDLYQEINGTYERLNTAAGDEFDEDYHKRKGNSLVNGRISQVLLQGYRGKANKKIQKSVVRI